MDHAGETPKVDKLRDDLVFAHQGSNKYLDDLFYVGPLYHQIFSNLDKLIFLDVGNHHPFL